MTTKTATYWERGETRYLQKRTVKTRGSRARRKKPKGQKKEERDKIPQNEVKITLDRGGRVPTSFAAQRGESY